MSRRRSNSLSSERPTSIILPRPRGSPSAPESIGPGDATGGIRTDRVSRREPWSRTPPSIVNVRVDAATWIEPLALVLLALALNLAGNARTGLWDRDEPRYAVGRPRDASRGDWLFPTFNGEPRYHKPILIYWLMGLATALAGDNPFGARLVSAIAGAGDGAGRLVAGPADVRSAGRVCSPA